MPFAQLATAAIARSLGQVADRESDLAEVFLEQLAETEVPPDGEAPGIRERSESGFAIRLVRDGLSWLAVRDGFEAGCFVAALREVARALPSAPYPEPSLEVEPLPPADLEELLSFPAAVVRAIRSRHVAFPIRLTVRRHHRAIQVVGTRLVPEAQEELYFSCEVELPWGRHGGLYPGLGRAVAGRLADRLVGLFAARDARPPRQGRHKVLFRPAAAAVLLHEAVAHALEADTLILGGRPEAASGLRLGSELVSVLDDPTTAPEPVRRDTDDEGMPAVRRWLLQEGVVRQPLADLYAARNSEGLTPGAARRAGRFCSPSPRSYHLELVPGEIDESSLRKQADGGLEVSQVTRGRLDPFSGTFSLRIPYAHVVRGGERGEIVGPFSLRGHLGELLKAVVGVSDRARPAGAGWCAKGGQRLPVWATAPSVLVEDLEVRA